MNHQRTGLLIAIGIPLLLAFAFWLSFTYKPLEEFLSVMSLVFFFLVPFLIGMASVLLAPKERVEKLSFRFFFPWAPVFAFLFITLLFSLEGWVCWVMALPLFLISSSMGGLFGYHLIKKSQDKKLNVSLLMMLPLLLAPIERQLLVNKRTFEVQTEIVLQSDDPSLIWDNITAVETIQKEEDSGWLSKLMTLPRPVRAVLDKKAVGGHRQAIFERGLVFDEKVIVYEDQKRMRFTIDADPQKIPATTMDEHIVIGGEFFDVLTGEYRLIPIDDKHYRVELDSEFQLKTSFNWYAGLWGHWIMRDIQQNILRVLKGRVEKRS
ncbi:MAG: hypothetical protein AAFV25_15330 [Bacteroidota bacterium]